MFSKLGMVMRLLSVVEMEARVSVLVRNESSSMCHMLFLHQCYCHFPHDKGSVCCGPGVTACVTEPPATSL